MSSFFNMHTKCIAGFIFLFSQVFSPLTISAEQHFVEEKFKYDKLGEHEEAFREFEIFMEGEDGIEARGWNKKIKRWWVKKVYKLLKKCGVLKKHNTLSECAYTVARFKRKVDKVYDTGSIHRLIKKIDESAPDNNSIEIFKDKIIYFSKHKHAKPNRSFNISANCYIEDGEEIYRNRKVAYGILLMSAGFVVGNVPVFPINSIGAYLAKIGYDYIIEGIQEEYNLKIIH